MLIELSPPDQSTPIVTPTNDIFVINSGGGGGYKRESHTLAMKTSVDESRSVHRRRTDTITPILDETEQ